MSVNASTGAMPPPIKPNLITSLTSSTLHFLSRNLSRISIAPASRLSCNSLSWPSANLKRCSSSPQMMRLIVPSVVIAFSLSSHSSQELFVRHGQYSFECQAIFSSQSDKRKAEQLAWLCRTRLRWHNHKAQRRMSSSSFDRQPSQSPLDFVGQFYPLS